MAGMQLNKDFAAGLLCFLIGVAAVLIARDYPFGSATQMGAGFFPVILGGLLMVMGGALSLMSFRKPRDLQPITAFELRVLVVVLTAVLLFAFMIEKWGMIVAVAALVLISRLAGREGGIVELALVTLILIGVSLAVFIQGLGLPIPVGFG